MNQIIKNIYTDDLMSHQAQLSFLCLQISNWNNKSEITQTKSHTKKHLYQNIMKL